MRISGPSASPVIGRAECARAALPLFSHERLITLYPPRHADRESRAATGRAFDCDVAAHHLAEAATDDEAEAGAAVFAARGRIDLGEFLEQFAHLLGGHADAGVGDRDGDPVATFLFPLPRVDGDSAVVSEFVGIAQQVQKRLPKTHLIRIQGSDRSVTIHRDLVSILCRQWFDGLNHAGDQRCEREGLELQLHATSFDLRQVEEVVDQGEQMPACAEHPIERLSVLLQCLRILPQHLADADDGVEGRAQLMAHVGQELGLVLARLCKLVSFLFDLMEQSRILDRQDRLRSKGLQ
jgi:hypothetical protein